MAEAAEATVRGAQSSGTPCGTASRSPVATLLAPRDLARPPPPPVGVPRRIPEPSGEGQRSCPLQRGAPPCPPRSQSPQLPLRPALLNGYKLEDKSAGFQAILSSISGNCCSPSSSVGMEEERRKTLSLLGLSPAANKHAEGAFLLGVDALGGETKPAASAGSAHTRSCCLLSTYCVPGTGRQVNNQPISRAIPTGTSMGQWVESRGALAH